MDQLRRAVSYRTSVRNMSAAAAYHAQAVEDHDAPSEYKSVEKKGTFRVLRHPPLGPSYRPHPLRWYFIGGQIVFISVIIALVAYVHMSLPDSHSTAIIHSRAELPVKQPVANLWARETEKDKDKEKGKEKDKDKSKDKDKPQVKPGEGDSRGSPQNVPEFEVTTIVTTTVRTLTRPATVTTTVRVVTTEAPVTVTVAPVQGHGKVVKPKPLPKPKPWPPTNDSDIIDPVHGGNQPPEPEEPDPSEVASTIVRPHTKVVSETLVQTVSAEEYLETGVITITSTLHNAPKKAPHTPPVTQTSSSVVGPVTDVTVVPGDEQTVVVPKPGETDHTVKQDPEPTGNPSNPGRPGGEKDGGTNNGGWGGQRPGRPEPDDDRDGKQNGRPGGDQGGQQPGRPQPGGQQTGQPEPTDRGGQNNGWTWPWPQTGEKEGQQSGKPEPNGQQNGEKGTGNQGGQQDWWRPQPPDQQQKSQPDPGNQGNQWNGWPQPNNQAGQNGGNDGGRPPAVRPGEPNDRQQGNPDPGSGQQDPNQPPNPTRPTGTNAVIKFPDLPVFTKEPGGQENGGEGNSSPGAGQQNSPNPGKITGTESGTPGSDSPFPVETSKAPLPVVSGSRLDDVVGPVVAAGGAGPFGLANGTLPAVPTASVSSGMRLIVTTVTAAVLIVPTPEAKELEFLSTMVVGGSIKTITHSTKQVVISESNRTMVTQTVPYIETTTTTEGGTTSTQAVKVAAGKFRPISTVVFETIFGGTVTVIKPTNNGLNTISLMTSDGTVLQTLVRMKSETEATRTIGGTKTTVIRSVNPPVTPTGTDAISIPVTFSETLSAAVSDGLLDNKGKLSTMVIRPLMTITSVRPASTVLYTTVIADGANGNAQPSTTTKEYNLTLGMYFVATFFPPLLAVALALPLRVIDLNAKMYQPFHALTKPGGALGSNSLTLQFSGVWEIISPVVVLAQGFPVPFLSTMAVLLGSLLTPLSSEAVGLKLHGTCTVNNARGCAGALGVSPIPAMVLIATLAVIMLLMAMILFFLRDFETGVYADPWSIAGISSLIGSPQLRRAVGSSLAEMSASGAERSYNFGYYQRAEDGREAYGIVPADGSAQGLLGDQASGSEARSGSSGSSSTTLNDGSRTSDEFSSEGVPPAAPLCSFTKRSSLSLWWRLAFLVVLLGLSTFVIYYHVTFGRGGAVNWWIAKNGFGVKFLLAALGVIVNFFWISFFLAVSVVVPYQTMAARPQPPERSILPGRPTNEFSGLYLAVKQRHVYFFVVSFMLLLSEFLPMLLANMPRNVSQIRETPLICARLTIAVLGLMIITMAASFFVKWPDMPADPRTIAGAMYYVRDSYMLEKMEGMSQMKTKEREARVKEWGRRYLYGEGVGKSGRRRMAVDSDELLIGRESGYQPWRR